MLQAKSDDGTKLHVTVKGEGPDVVLIHGWPLSHAMWHRQQTSLAAAGFRVIAYDRRGFGQSDKPDGGYDYDTLSDDLSAVLDAVDARRTALVGFSMGGGEVARYMSRHKGERVVRAALVSAVTPFLLQDESNPSGVPQEQFESMKSGIRDDRSGFFREFGKQFYGQDSDAGGVSDEVLEETHRVAMSASERATLDCIDAFATTDFRPDMAAFGIATLIVHGTGDAIVPIETSADKAVESIENARIERYEGAPHGLMATHAERLGDDLRQFLLG